ncbi:hypothetical protein TanjilG_16347 [Lupinus angustifolius]|uniref:Endoglucanase n=2 Tax=Lupinus angustifolius TaxID=3871 RepID=A0A1J7H7K4_LUPAN|nr:hypothetical protein TanjilG_16347 [Lupinus angustifolius]
MVAMANAASLNYKEALTKSIMFFEGQRSGKLPPSQRITWRKDSALNDGSDLNIDMVGGYYDAGDNVKFHFPMAFTTTMLAWSVIEFGGKMDSDLQHALEAVRWGSDYFLKATNKEDSIVAQVGESKVDHGCWERPEDMDTSRTTFVLSKEKPGSDVSGEIAAALAASSIVFLNTDATYSKQLLDRAKKVFDFANKYRGKYSDSVGDACPFYCDDNYMATKQTDNYYGDFVQQNIQSIGYGFAEFGWANKDAGINVLVSQWVIKDKSKSSPFVDSANRFICSLLPQSKQKSVWYSKGGLMFKPGGSNLQHATSISFLMIVYASYLRSAGQQVNCEDKSVSATPDQLITLARSQTDYILGQNPLGMSYMVGYGNKFPQKIHHRGSTLPSLSIHPQKIECGEGYNYFKLTTPNPNILTGSVVGGPADDDSFLDSQYNISQSEPTTYINAPFVGVLAYFNKP